MIVSYEDIFRVLLIASISMARMLACFTVVPFLGGNILPQYIRNVLLFALFCVVYPFVSTMAPNDIPMYRSIFLLGKEVFVGLVIGFIVSLLFWSAEMVGFLVDNQRGASMASTMDPLYGESTSPSGALLLQLITVLFFAHGGFRVFLEGVFESYRFWPVFEFLPRFEESFPLFFLEKMDALMRTAMLIAAPFLICIFLIDISLGIVNRFVPQLNVFFLSMPIKSGLASFLLVLYLSILTAYYLGSLKALRFLKNIVLW